MKQNDLCWKIRKLGTQPEITPNSIQKRDARRMKNDMHELVVVQCMRCKLILHRSLLASSGMRFEDNEVDLPVCTLSHVTIRPAIDEVFVFCGKCNAKIAIIGSSKLIKVQLNTVTTHVPQGRLFQDNPFDNKREPYDMLGAFSGLSYRNMMQEIYRLAYTKMQRYKLLHKTLGACMRKQQKRLKGLYNLILLTETTKGKSSKSDSRLQYDRAMRSTTIQHSHSHNPSRSLGKAKDSSLPH